MTLALAVGACNSAPPLASLRWDKAGGNEEEFLQDRHYCLRGATRVEGFYGSSREDAERFATCMSVRGYTRSASGRFGAPAEPLVR